MDTNGDWKNFAVSGAGNDWRRGLNKRLGHHEVVHHEPAADVEGDGFRDGIAVALVGGDGPGVAFVDVQREVVCAEQVGLSLAMLKQLATEAPAVLVGQ